MGVFGCCMKISVSDNEEGALSPASCMIETIGGTVFVSVKVFGCKSGNGCAGWH